MNAINRILSKVLMDAEAPRRMGHPARDAFGPAFSLLVWNVFKGKRPQWLRDLRRLAHASDLVLLQEAILRESSRDFFHASRTHEWVMAQSFSTGEEAGITGVKSGAVVMAEEPRIFVAPHREPILNTPKMILASRYAIAGRSERLLALNVHALNFTSTARFGRQMDQVLETVEGHRGPIVLAGDFNTWSRPRRDLLLRLIARLGLVPVEFGRRARMRHFNRVLDHVFVRALRVIAARTLREIRSSDHHPLEARLEFQDGPGAHHAAARAEN